MRRWKIANKPFVFADAPFDICTTLASQDSGSQPVLPTIPASKTWTALSTIQKLPTDHNNPTADYRPTTFASTVQSKSCGPQPAAATVDTTRTSVSKLRKSFEAVHNGKEVNQHKTTRRSTDFHVMVVPVIKVMESSAPTHMMSKSNAKPSLNTPGEHAIKDTLDNTPARPRSAGFFRLRTPVWDKNGGQSSSSPGNLPRRSKRSQETSANSSQLHLGKKTGKCNGQQEDDVSPTNSVGPGTPHLTRSEASRTDHEPVSAEWPPELWPRVAEDISAPGGETFRPIETAAPVQPTRKKGVLDPRKYSAVPGDGSPHQDEEDAGITPFSQAPKPSADTYAPRTSVAEEGTSSQTQNENEDTGVPLTCTISPNSFRRDSSAKPSPVRDRISIFEGLIKPSPHLPHNTSKIHAKHGHNKNRLNSQPFLTGTGILEGQRNDGWLPKSFRKMSFHLGRSKGQPNEVVGDQKHNGDSFISADEAKDQNEEVDSSAVGHKSEPQKPSWGSQMDDEPQAED